MCFKTKNSLYYSGVNETDVTGLSTEESILNHEEWNFSWYKAGYLAEGTNKSEMGTIKYKWQGIKKNVKLILWVISKCKIRLFESNLVANFGHCDIGMVLFLVDILWPFDRGPKNSIFEYNYVYYFLKII